MRSKTPIRGGFKLIIVPRKDEITFKKKKAINKLQQSSFLLSDYITAGEAGGFVLNPPVSTQ